jgi:predicted metalloprotease with PDZ domain
VDGKLRELRNKRELYALWEQFQQATSDVERAYLSAQLQTLIAKWAAWDKDFEEEIPDVLQ